MRDVKKFSLFRAQPGKICSAPTDSFENPYSVRGRGRRTRGGIRGLDTAPYMRMIIV